MGEISIIYQINRGIKNENTQELFKHQKNPKQKLCLERPESNENKKLNNHLSFCSWFMVGGKRSNRN